MSILLDSDVLIEYLRGDVLITGRFVREYRDRRPIYYTPVASAEIFAGLRRGEEEITSGLFGLMTCLTIDDAVGRKAGEYIKAFGASHRVEIADALVAAAAHRYDAALWTLNRKHYPMKDISFFEAGPHA